MTLLPSIHRRSDQVWGTFDDYVYDRASKRPKALSDGHRSFEILTRAVDSWRAIRVVRREPKVLSIAEIVASRRVEVDNYIRQSAWGKPCRNMFRELAISDTQMLSSILVYGNLRPTLLTFAAEALGTSEETNLVLSALVPLLYHDDAVVREGAVYGLAHHLSVDVVKTLFERCLESEDSPGVRAAIEEALAS